MKYRSWSPTRLLDFETCKRMFWMKYIGKKGGTTADAAQRGQLLHDAAEKFVTGTTDVLMPELALHFTAEFNALRKMYAEGRVSVEEEWGFSKKWEPASWKTAWLRLKLDARTYNKDRTHATVIDYKTGRRFGNEIKHAEQTLLYAIAESIRTPTVKTITTELWYVDINELVQANYSAVTAQKMLTHFDKRAIMISEEKDFPPSPSKPTCMYCNYRYDRDGGCDVGVGPQDDVANYRQFSDNWRPPKGDAL